MAQKTTLKNSRSFHFKLKLTKRARLARNRNILLPINLGSKHAPNETARAGDLRARALSPVCVETKQSSRPGAHARPFKYRVTCDAHYTFCVAICIQSGGECRRENAARRCVNRITTTGANKFQPSPLTSLSTPLCSSVLFRPRSQHKKEKCSCVDRPTTFCSGSQQKIVRQLNANEM